MHFREWKVLCFLKFHWSLFLRVQQPRIGSDDGLVPNRWQAIIWTNADSVRWCIYAALGGDELILLMLKMYKIYLHFTSFLKTSLVADVSKISRISTFHIFDIMSADDLSKQQARVKHGFNTLSTRQNVRHFAEDIFKCIFFNENNFNSNFIEVCCQGSNYQYASIGSENGLALNRQLAIIWTKGGLVYWCIYASLTLNELT